MIAILLAEKIAELFCYLILGFLLIRTGALKNTDTSGFTRFNLYLLMPCTILNAFQVELTETIRLGMLATFLSAVASHLIFILVSRLYAAVFGDNPIERASMIYSNAGNLIIPIVYSIFGAEWVIYITSYIIVFNILMWSHGRLLFTDKKNFHPVDFFKNVNVVAVLIGILMLAFHIKFSGIPLTVVSTLGGMIGPVSMFITGLVIGTMKLRNIFSNPRIYGVMLMRLFVCPFIVLVIMKVFAVSRLIPEGDTIFLISLLSAMAPQAGVVSQVAILYQKDPEYASSINVLSTALCIISMPLLVYLYEVL